MRGVFILEWLGGDHSILAKHKPKRLTVIDLTESAIEHTKKRIAQKQAFQTIK